MEEGDLGRSDGFIQELDSLSDADIDKLLEIMEIDISSTFDREEKIMIIGLEPANKTALAFEKLGLELDR